MNRMAIWTVDFSVILTTVEDVVMVFSSEGRNVLICSSQTNLKYYSHIWTLGNLEETKPDCISDERSVRTSLRISMSRILYCDSVIMWVGVYANLSQELIRASWARMLSAIRNSEFLALFCIFWVKLKYLNNLDEGRRVDLSGWW